MDPRYPGELPPLPPHEYGGAEEWNQEDQGGPAWEFRDRLGTIRAAIKTVSEVLFSPTDTFHSARRSGGIGSPILFYILMRISFGLIAELQSRWLQRLTPGGGMNEIMQREDLPPWLRDMMEQVHNYQPSFFQSLMALAIGAFLFTFVAALTTHVFLLLFGAAGSGFEATFRATCYCCGATAPLIAIPICGGLVALIWVGVVLIIALAEMHDTSAVRVTLALTVPALVIGCCIAGLMVLGLAALGGLGGGVPATL